MARREFAPTMTRTTTLRSSSIPMDIGSRPIATNSDVATGCWRERSVLVAESHEVLPTGTRVLSSEPIGLIHPAVVGLIREVESLQGECEMLAQVVRDHGVVV